MMELLILMMKCHFRILQLLNCNMDLLQKLDGRNFH